MQLDWRLPDLKKEATSTGFCSAIHCIVGSAQCACDIAKGSRNDLDAVSLGSPLDSCHKPGERIEECGSCLRDPATNNDNFGVERVDNGGDSRCEVFDRS